MAPSTPTQAATAQKADLEVAQPTARQSMSLDTLSTPTQNNDRQLAREQEQAQEQEAVHMRGGEMCPGRFCFIIPCPLPCNCCII